MELLLLLIIIIVCIASLFLLFNTTPSSPAELITCTDEIETSNDSIEESDQEYLNSFVIIDTETTGLAEGYQVVEIAIVDMDENIILSERVKPIIPIEKGASKIHGIEGGDLINANSFDSLLERFLLAIEGKRIAGYNLSYDTEAIYNSAIASGADLKFSNEAVCVMQYANTVFKRTRNMKLTELCEVLSINTANAHSAKSDALMTVKLMKKLFEIEQTFNDNYLPEFHEIKPLNLYSCKEGDLLIEWTSSDGRVMLFSPTSVFGSGRVAELTTETISKVNSIYDDGGDINYIVRYTNSIPTIDLVIFSKEEVEETVEQQRANYIDFLRDELPIAGVCPKKGRLRLTLKNNLILENNSSEYFNLEDTLYLVHHSLDDFLCGSLVLNFTDDSGKLVAQQSLSKPWLRVAGIITSGYKATVKIVIPTKKRNTKVDVIFERL